MGSTDTRARRTFDHALVEQHESGSERQGLLNEAC